jgi:hypothetical protein
MVAFHDGSANATSLDNSRRNHGHMCLVGNHSVHMQCVCHNLSVTWFHDSRFLAPLLLREAGKMVCYLISSLPACIPVIHSRSKPRRRQYISSAVLLNTTHVHSAFPKNNLSTAIRICLPFHYHFSSSLLRTTFIHSRLYMPVFGRASSRRNTV